ncbi:MAG: DUF1573 domain-containing protein [Bacteroidota bacterium]
MMKKLGLHKILLLLLFFLCFAYSKNASAQDYTESIQIGDDAFNNGDFYTASLYYNNALWFDSTDMKLAYKCAEAYRFFNNYQKAKQWYQYVLNNNAKGELPLTKFWLAMMEKSTEEYTHAVIHFRAYFNENKNKTDDYFTKKAKVELEACQEAPMLIANKKNVMIEHLNDGNINTPYSEFNAFQLSDTALVFSALRPIFSGDFDTYISNGYISKIYISKATNAGWSQAKEIDPKINDKENHNANICFSANRDKAFFTRAKSTENQNLQSEIFLCENENGKWQKAVKLPNKINMPGYTTTQPFYVEGESENILFFVSDRPGGMGKLDIWYSIIKNNEFQDPINLGSIINTPGDDITPFYRNANQTLYFSSDWLKGLGGFDVFYAVGKFNSWTTPTNIGYPINSSSNDLYFTVNEIDNDGYFTSNRPGSLFIKSETCCNDIYSYEWQDTVTQKTLVSSVIPKKDTVNIESTIKLMLPLTLYFHNDEPDPKTTAITTNKNYQTLLSDYYAMKDTYKTEYAKGLSGAAKVKAEKDIEDFFENYVAKGFANLKLFAKLLLTDLTKGNSVKIKIKGYCSPLTTTEYNLSLAKRRIASIINFLKQFHEGVFIEYLNGTAANKAKLVILEEPLGESTASALVSDNPNDKRNSIYSRAAAFERKIQIIMYQSETGQNNIPKLPQIQFTDTIHDFGVVDFGTKAAWVFKYKNTGNDDLMLTGVETSCGCTAVDWSKEPVRPGGYGELLIIVNSNEDTGFKDETVTVYSTTARGKNVLTIRANIIPKK